MPAFCCGFNEFGQVSSEADNLQRGFVSLPAVVDLQSKIASVMSHEGKAELADITTSSSAADAAADDDDEARTVVSAGVSWSGIYYVTADGRLCLCGLLNDITDRQSLSPVKPALCLQSLVDVSCVSYSWNSLYVVSGGLCYVTQLNAGGHGTSDWHCLHVPCVQQQTGQVSTMSCTSCEVWSADSDSCERFVSVASNETSTLAVTSARDLLSITRTEQDPARPVVQRVMCGQLKVHSVSCGKGHTLVLSAIGVVFSCGLGNQGQLGHGSVQAEQSGLRVVEALEGVRMVAVCAGGWHSMAVSDCGDVYVWGWNESGQLGLPCQSLRGRTSPGLAGRHSSTTDEDADNDSDTYVNLLTLPHVLDLPLTARDLHLTSDDLSLTSSDPVTYNGVGEVSVVKLASGSRHSVAVTSDGLAYSWGCNDYGQLGHGDLVSRDSPTVVEWFVERRLRVVDVFAGVWNSVFVTSHTAAAGSPSSGHAAV